MFDAIDLFVIICTAIGILFVIYDAVDYEMMKDYE